MGDRDRAVVLAAIRENSLPRPVLREREMTASHVGNRDARIESRPCDRRSSACLRSRSCPGAYCFRTPVPPPTSPSGASGRRATWSRPSAGSRELRPGDRPEREVGRGTRHPELRQPDRRRRAASTSARTTSSRATRSTQGDRGGPAVPRRAGRPPALATGRPQALGGRARPLPRLAQGRHRVRADRRRATAPTC